MISPILRTSFNTTLAETDSWSEYFIQSNRTVPRNLASQKKATLPNLPCNYLWLCEQIWPMECKKQVCPVLSLSPLPSECDASTEINHLGPWEWRLQISKGGEKHERLQSPKWLLLWLLLHKPPLLGVFAIATQSCLVLCHNDGYTKFKCLVQSHSWDPLYLPQFRDSLHLATTTDSTK